MKNNLLEALKEKKVLKKSIGEGMKVEDIFSMPSYKRPLRQVKDDLVIYYISNNNVKKKYVVFGGEKYKVIKQIKDNNTVEFYIPLFVLKNYFNDLDEFDYIYDSLDEIGLF
ncbi:hypothetical protein ACWYRQ_15045 [Clostridioides difficile]